MTTLHLPPLTPEPGVIPVPHRASSYLVVIGLLLLNLWLATAVTDSLTLLLVLLAPWWPGLAATLLAELLVSRLDWKLVLFVGFPLPLTLGVALVLNAALYGHRLHRARLVSAGSRHARAEEAWRAEASWLSASNLHEHEAPAPPAGERTEGADEAG